jgi:uncharacterized protein YndB with AHSA1/START domain
MPAISDIIINRPSSQVWAVIADAKTHPQWLGRNGVTKYEGDSELAEGLKFTRIEEATGATTEGEVVALKPLQFLKVKVDATDMFVITEYHLIETRGGCAVRVTCELYDTGEERHGYFPEEMEGQWDANLQRLKEYCEAR